MSIRRRVLPESYGLPVFDVDAPIANVCKNNARVDKFEVRFPNNSISYPSPDALHGFRERLAEKPAFEPLRNNYSGVRFSKHVLLSGKRIFFTPRNSGRGRCTLDIVVSANFNRFYQANQITSEDVGQAFRLESCEPIDITEGDLLELFDVNNTNLDTARAITLNHDDNILLRPRWQQTENVHGLLQLQIQYIKQLIENQFNVYTAAPLHDAHIGAAEHFNVPRARPEFDWTGWTIPHLEVCWDFHCPNAIAVAKHYQRPMQQVTTEMKTRYHRYDSEAHHNLVSHSAVLINNIKLSVYAKTKTRLRFEVAYHQKSLRSILASKITSSRLSEEENRKRRRVNDMHSLLDLALDDAEERLKHFLRVLHRHSNPPVVDRADALTQFLKQVCIATGGTMESRQEIALHEVFALMSQSGRIVVKIQRQPAYAPILDYLESHKILERVNRKQGRTTLTYSFTPEYQWLLDGLRG